MSSLREDMLSTVDDKEEEEDRDIVALRNRQSFAKSWKDYNHVLDTVVRYKFNQQRWDDFEYAWDTMPMRGINAAGFAMDKIPFGKGAERLAFRFQEINSKHKLVGHMMVAKESKKIQGEGQKIKFHEFFCRSQLEAGRLAGIFNKRVAKTPSLRPVEESAKLPLIIFLACDVYAFKDEHGKKAGVLVENFLKGKWVKYTKNDGSSIVTSGGRTIEIAAGKICAVDFLHAFSHWSYVHTHDKLLVCDLQGVFNEEGWAPRFELTDPAICSRHKRPYHFGKTDLGRKGMRGFCQKHKCNLVCKSLGLAAFGTRPKDSHLRSTKK
jgi:hypothetical protein